MQPANSRSLGNGIGNLDLGSSIANENLRTLYHRTPGQRFYVNESGQLKLVTGFWKLIDKICRLFCCCTCRCSDQKVKAAITNTILLLTPERIQRLNNDKSPFCQRLFFERMSRLSSRIFDRSVIPEGVKQILINNIEAERTETVFKQEHDGQNPLIKKIRVQEEKMRIQQRFLNSRSCFQKFIDTAFSLCNCRSQRRVQETFKRTLSKLTPAYIRSESPTKGLKERHEKTSAISTTNLPEHANKHAEEKSEYESHLAKFTPRRQEYENRVKEVLYRLKLGLELERIREGTSGVYAGKNIASQKLLALKPCDEGPYGPNNPNLFKRIQRWVCENVFFCTIRPDLIRNTEHIAEAVASAVHEAVAAEVAKIGILDFDVIPFTRLEEFRSKVFKGAKEKLCSCKVWLNNFVTANVYVPTIDLSVVGKGLWYYKSKTLPNNLNEFFQWFSIMEFVLGDQDGHPGNIAIQGPKVKGFDFGLSGPGSHPRDFRSTIKQYAWAQLTNAVVPFMKSSQDIIACIYNAWDKIVKTAREAGYRLDQEQAMQQRIMVLYHYRTKSPRELAQIKTPDDFSRVLISIKEADEKAKSR